MAKAYYSTVFDHSADAVWNTIRDFNNYPVWVDGAGESTIEDGKSGDAVGAVRNVLYQDNRIRQRLLALSDVERTQTYAFAGAPPSYVGGLAAFEATIRVAPVVDGNRAFVEWFAIFDATESRREELRTFLADAFARWLGSLRRTLAREAAALQPAAPH
jgi:polyketide cyclase/dehydrase/lipid transport protein